MPGSDLFNVVVLGRGGGVLTVREHGGVGGRPRMVGREGRQGPPEAGGVLLGVQVGGQHWWGGLSGDGPAGRKLELDVKIL